MPLIFTRFTRSTTALKVCSQVRRDSSTAFEGFILFPTVPRLKFLGSCCSIRTALVAADKDCIYKSFSSSRYIGRDNPCICNPNLPTQTLGLKNECRLNFTLQPDQTPTTFSAITLQCNKAENL